MIIHVNSGFKAALAISEDTKLFQPGSHITAEVL